tara:strand:+ start:9181 stop:9708 length:528 start_codon:yes stop_codon:yes gene_type:complete
MNLPKLFILDVDGVLTTGSFLYNENGKCLKIFGPDDNDGLKLLKDKIEIIFVTGDKRGFEISKKRIVDDMGYELYLVSTIKRIEWIKERYNPKEIIYMGDGIFDSIVMQFVGYSIAPQNSDEIAKNYADYVTKRSGGDRAVAEACMHILQKFYSYSNIRDMIKDNFKDISEEWIG